MTTRPFFRRLPALVLTAALVAALTAPALAAGSGLEGVARDALGGALGSGEPNQDRKERREAREKEKEKEKAGKQRGAGLGGDTLVSGLKEALSTGTTRTVQRLGKTNGFLKDKAVHIPLPASFDTARTALGLAGMSGTLDELETRMNRAAEAAVPKAANIFGNAITGMGIADARGILDGADDAATQYFKRTTTKPLTKAFAPIVEKELAQVGAVQAYQALAGQAGGLLGGFDLTDYVVGKALDGVFHYVAKEEAAIRANPAAAGTDLLRSVFGY